MLNYVPVSQIGYYFLGSLLKKCLEKFNSLYLEEQIRVNLVTGWLLERKIDANCELCDINWSARITYAITPFCTVMCTMIERSNNLGHDA